MYLGVVIGVAGLLGVFVLSDGRVLGPDFLRAGVQHTDDGM